MLTNEQKNNIIKTLDVSIENLYKNIDNLDESAITAISLDTVKQICNEDSLVGALMNALLGMEACSSEDDFPYTDKEYAYAVLGWLSHMKAIIEKVVE